MRLKKLHLIDDWRRVLRKAWSIKFAVIAAILGVVEGVLPMFTDLIPRGIFVWLMLAATLAGLYARLVSQPKMNEPWWMEGVAKPPRGTCKMPPPGWWCSGAEGHKGPCAAWPEDRA